MSSPSLGYTAFETALQRELQRRFGVNWPEQSLKLVLGYSGGLDSEVLAHLLSRFAVSWPSLTVSLVHVHHGLSENADEWAQHCQTRAAEYGLPIEVHRVSLQKPSRTSLEAIAREARYQVFYECLAAPGLLLTAHHLDDQTETQLLALKRGGLKGLSGVARSREFGDDRFVFRPLLDWTREQISECAKRHGLVNIEDESNQDTRFDRNFLRQRVLPELNQRWPSFRASAARSGQLLAEQTEALKVLLASVWPDYQADNGALALSKWREQPVVLRSQLLRYWLELQGKAMPSAAQTQQLLSQLAEAKADAKVIVELDGYSVRRFGDCAHVVEPPIMRPMGAMPIESDGWILNDGRLQLRLVSQGARLRRDIDITKLELVFGAPSSTRCHPHFRDRSRSLKKLWQELSVPPWQRDQVPLLFLDGQLVLAMGYWVDKSCLALDEQAGWQLSWAD
ncbi:tRNA lysidine(34) synthetase TilS [Paraferrimonas sedimenticola]|uniref:tRNA(Ile)-lysidine synthase n=1 Tax=Paraferrimonas sedimenticola TaxID=375674 RepID=A0AA37RWW0_9GAMM|nr:tRNA lysidine(34) synthetase TilS [Paraferrimonas sedimenticola]GLP96705.1 tRNA(Ile)-lysidine synthase [Paraferrimonas sedimenticola]